MGEGERMRDLGAGTSAQTTRTAARTTRTAARATPTMRAAWVGEPSPEDPVGALQCGNASIPSARDGWTRVRMTRTSLNRHDIAVLMGRAPQVGLGCEGVGRLDDGTEVLIYPFVDDTAATAAIRGNHHGEGDGDGDGEQPGRNGTRDIPLRIHHPRAWGLMSEYALVPTENLVPMPADLPINAAAVIGWTWLTAYQMLFTLSDLVEGERMLVQGSCGGVATALIQLGRVRGMEVWTTGRSAAARAVAVRLGAARTFSAGEQLPGKVRAVFNVCGAATWEHAMQSVEDGGSIILCGSHSGRAVEMDLAEVLSKRITIRASGKGTRREFGELLEFVMHHRIRPLIDSIIPMEAGSVEQGLERMLAGEVSGKIIVAL